MAEEDYAFLGEERVYEDDYGVGVGAGGGEVWMQCGEGLRGGAVRGAEGGDQLYEGEVADCFGGDGDGDFDGDGDGVVEDAGFEFVGVAGEVVLCPWARWGGCV